MATETDVRLRSWLDANQRDREQMCRAILALDPHYSGVCPRHPSGGPDGGRDIEAVYDGERVAYGAVGFVNGANDGKDQKKKIKKKFADDLGAALKAKSDLKVFVFMTNLQLSAGDQKSLVAKGKKAGIEHCQVLDRERLRIELDSPAGFFIRFQYLGIELSGADQASFLSRYGDRIQDVVSTGFGRVERTLDRILFLQESADVLQALYVRFQLKESFPAADISHFRAFVILHLRAITHGILAITFGSSDRETRFRSNSWDRWQNEPAGIGHAISHGQWERHFGLRSAPATGNEESDPGDEVAGAEGEDDKSPLIPVGEGSGIGMDPVSVIVAKYSHDDALIRFRPRLALRDLDDCMFLPVLNASLAEMVQTIEVFANGYLLTQIGPADFSIDRSELGVNSLPGAFTSAELADPWVRLRPSNGTSAFHLRFDSKTPRRIFEHTETPEPRSLKLK